MSLTPTAEDQAFSKGMDLATPEWQPIETAPKDGTPILCFNGGNNSIKPHITTDHYRNKSRGNHYTGFGYENKSHWPHTHWMPLPNPPEGIS